MSDKAVTTNKGAAPTNSSMAAEEPNPHEQMAKALDEVKKNRMGMREAAKAFGVGYYSLRRRFHHGEPGPKNISKFLLKPEEEGYLVEELKLIGHYGYGFTVRGK